MKTRTEIEIALPRERVIELFDSPDNLKKWQPGLVSFEHLSGEHGKAGAKYQLVYDMNGRRVEMVETIVRRDLPDEFSATYEGKGVMNRLENRFHEDMPEKTRWVQENEFEFRGLMKIMGLFIRKAIPRQTLEDMNRFKEFAEGS